MLVLCMNDVVLLRRLFVQGSHFESFHPSILLVGFVSLVVWPSLDGSDGSILLVVLSRVVG